MLQAGKVPPASWATMLGNNAPFQLTSFALSLLLVFRQAGRWARGSLPADTHAHACEADVAFVGCR